MQILDLCRRSSLALSSMLMLGHSVVSDSATAWPVVRKAPLSMGFPRQEYWGGSPFPPPGDLPDPGIKPVSPTLAGGFFTTEPPGKPFTGRPSIILDSVLGESKVIWSFLP